MRRLARDTFGVVIAFGLVAVPMARGAGAPWALGALGGAGAAQAKGEATDHARADAAFSAGRFEEAASLYEKITDEHPEDATAWYRLGYSLHALGRYEDAAGFHRRAAGFDHQRSDALYNLACAEALLGRTDDAIATLRLAIEEGFARAELMEVDTDLDSLRDDPRFEALRARARAGASDDPIRAFDFWVGAWDVFSPAGQLVGRNVVRSLHEGRVIEENWTSARGGTGMSMNFYDPERRKWRQVWVDKWGGIVEYEGSFRDGAMRMEGRHVKPDGSHTLQRVSLTPGEDGSVRQLIEESSDGGKTWTTCFDGRYARREGVSEEQGPE